MRVVLDTNVWLDWLVFEGRQIARLRAACEAKQMQPVIDAPCLEELERVLAYREFDLDAGGIRQRLDEVRALSVMHPAPAFTEALPRCRDRDDQKFLVLAASTSASALFTRDKALLRLAGRTRRQFGFDIVEPDAWPGTGSAPHQS